MRHTTARNTLTVIALAVTVLAFSVGCSRFGTNEAESDSLVIWTPQYGERGTESGFDKVIADFTEETGIKVNYTTYGTDDMLAALANATGTSAMPDIFQLWSGIGQIGNIYDAGAIEPLDEYADEYGWEGRFNEAALSLDIIDGKQIGIPMTVHAMAVVYSKPVFERAGITSPPQTFEELLSVNQQLVDAGITPFAFSGKQSWHLMRLSDSLLEATCGAEKFDALRNMELNWNEEPCALDAFTQLKQWQRNGWLPADFMALEPSSGDHYKAIYDGTAAMTIDGDWVRGGLELDGQDIADYGLFPFPTSTDRLSYFTESLYMSSESTKKDSAAKFLDFISDSEEYAKHQSELNSLIPPINEASILSETPLDQEWLDITRAYTDVYLPADQALVPDVAAAFLRAQDQLMIDELDPAGVVAAIQNAIDQL